MSEALFANASLLEILWSLASGIAALIHLWLTLQAYLDWQATRQDRPERQRGISARWYLIGQFCLFLPKLLELAIGVYAMGAPNPKTEQGADAAAWVQSGLIAGEWIGVVGAMGFWAARRALADWARGDSG